MSETAPELFVAAQNEMLQGRYENAIAFAKRGIALDPRNATALHGVAVLCFQSNKWEDAAEYSFRACVEQMSKHNIAVLFEISKYKAGYQLARDRLLKLLEIYPDSIPVLRTLGALYERTGYRSLAKKYFEIAVLKSRDVEQFLQYGKLFPFQDAGLLFNTLSRIPPTDAASPQDRVTYEMEMVTRKEHAERAARGMGIMAASVDELFFNFARNEGNAVELLVDPLLARHPNEAFLHYAKASCLIIRKEYEQADKYFKYLAQKKPDHLYANVSFSEAFYQDLVNQNEDAVFGTLPDLVTIKKTEFKDGPIIFLSSDFNYYENFARPMLTSIERMSPHTQVHLHIINLPEQQITSVLEFCKRLETLNLAITAEHASVSTREYYHAIRFVRFYQLLKRYQLPLVVMDVDAILHRDIRPELEAFGDADIALSAHTGMWPVWNQFRAGIVGIKPTTSGLQYSRLIALYILFFYAKDQLRWGIDQAALYIIYTFMLNHNIAPAIKLWGDQIMAGDCDDSAVIWCKSGNAKFEQTKALDGESAEMDSPYIKYMQALDDLGYGFE